MAELTAAHATHHFTRRRARKVARGWNVRNPVSIYKATDVKAERGPYRYRAVLVIKKHRRWPID